MHILNCHQLSIAYFPLFLLYCRFVFVPVLQACVACFQGPVFLRVQAYPCGRQESRALTFSEEKTHWQLPMNDVNIVCDVTTKDGMSPTLAVLTVLARFVSMF